MRILPLLLIPFIFLFASTAHAKFEEQEQFLAHDPGMSEFFYMWNGEKQVKRVGISVHSHWTPTKEQMANIETVTRVEYAMRGMSVPATIIHTEKSQYTMLHIRGAESWTKVGNRVVVINRNTLVDLDNSLAIFLRTVSEPSKTRKIQRTWEI